MARILHLSDLHFGAHDPRLVEAVEIRVDEAKADLVVISGDFTQRARTEQFEEACQFLTRLKDRGHEVLGVPGNHDLLLAGHNHRASTHHAPDLVTRAGPALVIQAGTATSTRLRDEEQSFNIIEVAADDVTIAVQAWDGNAYASCDAQRYRRVDGAWKLATGVTQGASAETAAVS